MGNAKANQLKTTRHIARKILQLRVTNNLTQEKFAEKINVDIRTVSRAESGCNRPSAETLEMIAEAFNVPISYFYDKSIYEINKNKAEIILEINAKLNVSNIRKLSKLNKLIDYIQLYNIKLIFIKSTSKLFYLGALYKNLFVLRGKS